jgi:hypothetical protein
MSAHALLEYLRRRDVILEVSGERLHVDAPRGTLTDELCRALKEHKPQLMKLLEWERCKLEEADRRGLVIKWAEELDWIALHDPTTGEWHEVKASECLPGVVEAAGKHRRKAAVRGT